jgi:hypothetical protein
VQNNKIQDSTPLAKNKIKYNKPKLSDANDRIVRAFLVLTPLLSKHHH